MPDADGRGYADLGKHIHLVPLANAVTVAGTNAAIAAIANKHFKIPASFNGIVRSVGIMIKTGGTVASAGATLLLQRSLAGTGAFSSFGTCAFLGTYADGDQTNLAVTQSEVVLGGDVLRLAIAAGTVAQSLVIHALGAFQEQFVAA